MLPHREEWLVLGTRAQYLIWSEFFVAVRANQSASRFGVSPDLRFQEVMGSKSPKKQHRKTQPESGCSDASEPLASWRRRGVLAEASDGVQ